MPVRFDILTLFPNFFLSPLKESLLGKALEKGLVEVGITDIRSFAADRHRVVDDLPYGGGAGMVMKPEPVASGLESVRRNELKSRRILLSPDGKRFDQSIAEGLLQYEQIILICGRYEGVDERIRQYFVDEDLSIGDYVLSGGEAAAIVVIETVVRLISGVVGNEESLHNETFSRWLLDYPQYTRPREFRGISVPEVLVSGNHEEIRRWRQRAALERTLRLRPDLIERAKNSNKLSEEDISVLMDLEKEKIN